MTSRTKFIIEIGPLLAFFAANAWGDIYIATAVIMTLMPISMFASWKIQGKITPILWFSTILVIGMGAITLYLNDDRFIKIKPTVLYSFFSLLLFLGLWRKKLYMKYFFDQAMPAMTDKGWALVTRNWALFLLFKALLNEFVWRNYSTDTWVSVKVFGFVAITFIFFFSQVPLMMRHSLPTTPKDSQ